MTQVNEVVEFAEDRFHPNAAAYRALAAHFAAALNELVAQAVGASQPEQSADDHVDC